ncbi:MAG: type II toxin-antitoxin system PemK/MazF family toxin [Candidatus Nanopelagicales bacterium]
MNLEAGTIVWCELDPVVGSEQGGRRPALIISSLDYSAAMSRMTIVVPCTTRQRQWPNHVPLFGPTGLSHPTFAITEQPRAISVDRVRKVAGRVDDESLARVCRWVHLWEHQAA